MHLLKIQIKYPRRKISIIDDNANCRHLKNLPVNGLYLSEAQNHKPPPLAHCKQYVYQYTHSHKERGEEGEFNQGEC